MNILRRMLYVAALVPAVLSSAAAGQERWRDFRVLATTRGEAEKVLGPPQNPGCTTCRYRPGGEEVTVDYAPAPCRGAIPGWNVRSGTMLRLHVRLSTPRTLTELNTETKDLLTGLSDTNVPREVDQRGIVYYLDRARERVEGISFLPGKSDAALRCRGFAPFNTYGYLLRPDISTLETDPRELMAVVQNSYFQIQPNKGWLAHFIIYSGNNRGESGTTRLIARLRGFAAGSLRAEPGKLAFVYGGRRKRFSVDVFFTSTDSPPPVPSPTS